MIKRFVIRTQNNIYILLQNIKRMEYELKRTQILQQVQFKNLLSVSLVQNKLQRNFRSIVQALMLNQQKTDGLNDDHILVKQQHSKQIRNLNEMYKQMKKQMEKVRNDQRNSQFKGPQNQLVKLQSRHEVEAVRSTKMIERTQNPLQDNSHNLDTVANNLAKNMNQKIKDWQNQWSSQKDDLMKQIDNLKGKLDNVGFLQDQFKNFRIDLRFLKDQLAPGLKSNNNTKSCKTMIKRQSILNMAAYKNIQKNVQKKQQPSNHSIKIPGKDTSKDQDKQNNPNPNLSTQSGQSQGNQQNSANQAFQKQINSLYLDINTLKITLQELRDMLSDTKKQGYKNNLIINEVKDDLNRQMKTRKTQNQQIQKTLKDIKMQMLNMQPMQMSQFVQSQEKVIKDSQRNSKTAKKNDDDFNLNYKNQLNDKLSRMQAMIQNLVTQSQFNRFKNEVNGQLQKLGTKLQSTDLNLENTQKKLQDLIVQYQVNTNQQLADSKNRMSSFEDQLKNQTSQNQRKNNILQAKLEQLKKSLQNLREDMQFYQSLMTQQNSSGKQQKKTEEAINMTNQSKPINSASVDDKALQALKKYFSGKMHDLRTNLLGLIRELEKKMNNKSNGDQEFINIWDKLNEVNLFMSKKADQDDTKKTYLYLQKKINRLNSEIFKNEDNTEDARIARSNNWQCLSCDKNLHAYQGKIGKHVIWETMPLKGINKSTIANPPEEKRKGLPQLKK